MFKDCKSLSVLDLSDFDTLNVNDMSCMFYGCYSLKDLNLFNFETQNTDNIDNIFYGCYSLKKDDITTNDKRIKNQVY